MTDVPSGAISQEMTIDELARATGTTVRNIRAHQSRGLLPPPEIRVRTGYYGPEHLARLRWIQAMQAEGFRLDAIARLLEQPGAAAEQILTFGRALLNSFGDTVPEFVTTTQLAERFGGRLDRRVVRKAERLGLLHPLDDDHWEIRNPTLVAAGEQLAAMGIPLTHAIAVAEKINQHTRAIAKAYIRLFLADVMGRDGSASRSEAEWERLNDALARLQPIAVEAIRAGFEQAMAELVEAQLKTFIEHT